MFITALLLATALDSPPPSGPAFLPSKVSSSNGWELSIRPFNTDGLHGAEYVLRAPAEKSGVEWGGAEPRKIAWQGSRIWTLRYPIVSDRGWTYGSAIVNPSAASLRDSGTTYILALDAEGTVRIEDHFPDSRSGPWVGPLVPIEDFNTLVARVGHGQPHPTQQDLWFYDFEGKKRASCETFGLVRDDTGYPTAYTITTDVIAVRGEPLVLLHGVQHFSDVAYEWSGACDRWALVDLNGVRVWSLDDAKDPRLSDRKMKGKTLERRRNNVTSSKTGEFETIALRTNERVVYAVSLDPTTNQWSVMEKSRVPMKPEPTKK